LLCDWNLDIIDEAAFVKRGESISSSQWEKFTHGSEKPQRPDPPPVVKYDVFLSHAGTEKREIVSHIYESLKSAGLRVFVDYDSLKLGNYATTEMVEAAWSAPVGLFVLSKDFLQREWPEKELRIFLERHKEDRSKAKLVPFFYKVAAWSDDPTLTPEQRALLYKVSEFSGLEKLWGSTFDADHVKQLTREIVRLVREVKPTEEWWKTYII